MAPRGDDPEGRGVRRHPLTDANMTRLPRNQSEGDMPKIALTTGGADALECLLRKIGIDDSEFTAAGGHRPGQLLRGHRWHGSVRATLGGGAFTSVAPWWDDVNNLSQYDMVLLACEGDREPGTRVGPPPRRCRRTPTRGGRVFASHWHNYWIEKARRRGPPIANFNHQADLPDPFTATIDTASRGAGARRLAGQRRRLDRAGEIEISGAQHTIDRVGTGAPVDLQRQPAVGAVLTFNTPIGAQRQCGRVVSDIHVSRRGAAASDSADLAFPDGCKTDGTVGAGEGAGLHAVRPVVLHRHHRLSSAPL